MELGIDQLFDYSIQKALRRRYARIESQKQVRGQLGREHTVYVIQIIQRDALDSTSEFKSVERRYRDFEDMHYSIREERKSIILPALPPKHHSLNMLFGATSIQSDRRTELEAYLNKLMTNREVQDADAFIDFTTKVCLKGSLRAHD